MKHPFCYILLIFCLYPTISRSQARIHSFLNNSGVINGLSPVAQTHSLKGYLKQITQVQSPLTNRKADWLDGYSGQNYSEEYNKQGFLLVRTSRDDFNQPQIATHYEYNRPGQISAIWGETLATKPFGGRTEGRITYEFNPVKKVYIVRDNRIIMGTPQNRRVETSVDSVNRVMVQHEFSQDTLLVREQVYKWDVQRYITKQASRSHKRLDERFQADTAGFSSFMKNELGADLSESEKKSAKKSLDSLMYKEDSLQRIRPEWTGDTTTYKNQYDAQTRLTRQETYRHNQLTEIVSFTYALEATRVVRQSYNRNGDMTSETISLQHPTEHNILSDTSRFRNGDKWNSLTYNHNDYPKPIYRYKYDDQGNWIEQKQVDTTGKQIGVALVRIIEYY